MCVFRIRVEVNLSRSGLIWRFDRRLGFHIVVYGRFGG